MMMMMMLMRMKQSLNPLTTPFTAAECHRGRNNLAGDDDDDYDDDDDDYDDDENENETEPESSHHSMHSRQVSPRPEQPRR